MKVSRLQSVNRTECSAKLTWTELHATTTTMNTYTSLDENQMDEMNVILLGSSNPTDTLYTTYREFCQKRLFINVLDVSGGFLVEHRQDIGVRR